MKRVLKWIAIIFGVVILIVIISPKSEKTVTTTSDVKEVPTIEEVKVATLINVTEFADEFDANQVAAEKKWEGQFVEFSAKISNITDSGLSFVGITQEFLGASISCRIKDETQLLPLKNGELVIVRGIVGNQTMGIIRINDCEVVK